MLQPVPRFFQVHSPREGQGPLRDAGAAPEAVGQRKLVLQLRVTALIRLVVVVRVAVVHVAVARAAVVRDQTTKNTSKTDFEVKFRRSRKGCETRLEMLRDFPQICISIIFYLKEKKINVSSQYFVSLSSTTYPTKPIH